MENEKNPIGKSSSFTERRDLPEKSGSLSRSSTFTGHGDAAPIPQITADSFNVEENSSDPNATDVSDVASQLENRDEEGKENQDGDVNESIGQQQEQSIEELNIEIDQLIFTLNNMVDKSSSPEIPNAVEMFANLVQSEVEKYDTRDSPVKFGQDPEEDAILIHSVSRIANLTEVLGRFSPDPKIRQTRCRYSMVLQHAMNVMEEELRILLDDSSNNSDSKTPKSAKHNNKDSSENSVSAESNAKTTEDEQKYPPIPDEIVSIMQKLAVAMVSAGYETECYQVMSVSRRKSFLEAMRQKGFEKVSIDEVQKMQWEPLEAQISTWITVVKHSAAVLFPGEKKLCFSIFHGCDAIIQSILTDLAESVVILFLNFAEAVALMKRSAERLFKILDIYEALTDVSSAIGDLLPSTDRGNELKSEISAVRRRLAAAAVCIFCDLENSIKGDAGRNPVPGGAVHPLTRYTMNYLRYACDFKDTLEQVFSLHHSSIYGQLDQPPTEETENENNTGNEQTPKKSAFAVEFTTIMEQLDSNLEAKSKLYKEPSLRYIFLMNNGRYIMQKIKESPEIRQLVGDNCRRKRSSELRAYHKNYQRETWSKVLQCLNHEGLQVNGKVHKPILKDRFKNFNQLFEEIHKTQSTWVVSDEQLQSELRVSISAVMIPAYRSFVARFGQYFTPGRQAEKYIKYQPEDIESVIEELFDGNSYSMAKRRN